MFIFCKFSKMHICGMGNPPRPRIEAMPPALAGQFLTTVPPGNPLAAFTIASSYCTMKSRNTNSPFCVPFFSQSLSPIGSSHLTQQCAVQKEWGWAVRSTKRVLAALVTSPVFSSSDGWNQCTKSNSLGVNKNPDVVISSQTSLKRC